MSSPTQPLPAEEQSVCPDCGRGKLRRSHRQNAAEVIRSWFGWYPYRCHECQGRLYWKRDRHDPPAKPDKRPEARRRARRRTAREILSYSLAIAAFVALLLYIIREPAP